MLPIEEDTDQCMRLMGDAVKAMIGSKYGFALLVFPFGEDEEKVAHYISDSRREDIIKALREKADVLEKGLDFQVSGKAIDTN